MLIICLASSMPLKTTSATSDCICLWCQHCVCWLVCKSEKVFWYKKNLGNKKCAYYTSEKYLCVLIDFFQMIFASVWYSLCVKPGHNISRKRFVLTVWVVFCCLAWYDWMPLKWGSVCLNSLFFDCLQANYRLKEVCRWEALKCLCTDCRWPSQSSCLLC